jgi:hypothetical protein
MRTVTQKVVKAWQMGSKKTVDNTRTDGSRIYLHGNCIAKRDENGSVYITDGGWQTSTTRERLNGILATLGIPQRVYQKNFALYFGGVEWDGSWMMVR